MDGTAEAFTNALQCHVEWNHTIGGDDDRRDPRANPGDAGANATLSMHPLANGSRVLGAHFYGPYFRYKPAGASWRTNSPTRRARSFRSTLEFADDLVTATVAPEIPRRQRVRTGLFARKRCEPTRATLGHV